MGVGMRLADDTHHVWCGSYSSLSGTRLTLLKWTRSWILHHRPTTAREQLEAREAADCAAERKRAKTSQAAQTEQERGSTGTRRRSARLAQRENRAGVAATTEPAAAGKDETGKDMDETEEEEEEEEEAEVPASSSAAPLPRAAQVCVGALSRWVLPDRALAWHIDPLMAAMMRSPVAAGRPSLLHEVITGMPNVTAMRTDGCLDELKELGLAGCHHFAHHSDHDGAWSTGECADILSWLQRLLDGSVDLEPEEQEYWGDNLKEKMKEYVSLFSEAVERKTVVLLA